MLFLQLFIFHFWLSFYSHCLSKSKKLLYGTPYLQKSHSTLSNNFENGRLKHACWHIIKNYKLTMFLASKSLWCTLSWMENNSFTPYKQILRKIIWILFMPLLSLSRILQKHFISMEELFVCFFRTTFLHSVKFSMV